MKNVVNIFQGLEFSIDRATMDGDWTGPLKRYANLPLGR